MWINNQIVMNNQSQNFNNFFLWVKTFDDSENSTE